MNNEFFLPTLENFKKILSECIAIELAVRVDQKDKQIVADFISNILAQIKIHTIHTSHGVENIADTIFGVSQISEFVLSLTDTFFIEINGNFDCDKPKEKLIGILSNNIDEKINSFKNQPFPTLEYQKSLNTMLYANAKSLKKTLSDHEWLIVIILIHLSFKQITQIQSLE